MSARSKVFPSLITSADVIEFRAGWERAWPSATTRQNAQQNVRSFLRTSCRENLNDLLAALKTIRLSKVDKERLEPKPFTEKEIKVLFAQIPKTFPAEKVAVSDTAREVHDCDRSCYSRHSATGSSSASSRRLAPIRQAKDRTIRCPAA